MTKFECNVNQLNKRWEACTHLSESIFSLCACCCHLKTLLDTLAACPYISIVMSFCSRTKNTITCSFCWAKMFMHLIMTRWSKLSLFTSIFIRKMSEVMVDYVSVSLFCCFFLLSFRSSQNS